MTFKEKFQKKKAQKRKEQELQAIKNLGGEKPPSSTSSDPVRNKVLPEFNKPLENTVSQLEMSDADLLPPPSGKSSTKSGLLGIVSGVNDMIGKAAGAVSKGLVGGIEKVSELGNSSSQLVTAPEMTRKEREKLYN